MLAPAGIGIVRDQVLAIDPAKRMVTCSSSALHYDYLVVATGAENNFFDVPGAQEHSFRFRTPEDADRICANLARLLAKERKDLHLVLAGGGTEGVEVAGELLDLIHSDSRTDDQARGAVTITLVESQQHLLPGFSAELQTFAEDYLRNRGVAIVLGEPIAAICGNSVVLASGAEFPQSMVIWTGGIKPSQLIRDLLLPKDPAGWLLVNDRLQSPADDHVYAVGDIASIQGPSGLLLLPRLASHAQDQARTAGGNIAAQLSGKDPIPYAPHYKPGLLSIGKDMGIFIQGNTFKTGAWVVALKKAVERKHMMSLLSRSLLSRYLRKVPGFAMLGRLRMRRLS